MFEPGEFIGIDPLHAQQWGKVPATCPYPQYVRAEHKLLTQRPCGQCLACKVRIEKERSARCFAESLTVPSAVYSLTLTDQVLAQRDWYSPDTWRAECDALQRRLRRRTGGKCLVRFVAETGGETDRPHMHAVVHGVRPIDVPTRQLKHQHFDFWKHGHGTVDKVTAASVRYVLGYIYDDEKLAKRIFTRTSQRIGFEYFHQWCRHMVEGRGKHGARYSYYPDPATGLMDRPLFEIDHRRYRMDPKLKEIAKSYGLVESPSGLQQAARAEFNRSLDIFSEVGGVPFGTSRKIKFDCDVQRNSEKRAQSAIKKRFSISGFTLHE